MKLIDIEQNTPEWHEYRKTRIGASIAPVIMGVSPYQTPYQLWEEFLGYRERPESNPAMQRGTILEPKVRGLYEEKYSIAMFPQLVEHDDLPWMCASLDGLSVDNAHAIEIKCGSQSDHETVACEGKIPYKYYPQLQHQLAITNHAGMHFVSFYENEINIAYVARDDEYISRMIEKEREFLDCVLTFTPPPLSEKDYVSKEEDKDWLEYSTQWGILQAQKKFIEKQEKELKEAIVKSSDGRNCKGFGLTSLKIVRKGNVDYTAIPELKTIDLEQYRKAPSEYWKIA